MSNRTEQKTSDVSSAANGRVGSSALLGGLRLSGCENHPHRLDLSCCKIRREDGTPLSVADTWAEIQRLRDALSFRKFEHVLRKHGLVDPSALDDPEGFDNYRTHSAVHAAHRELSSPNKKDEPRP